MFQRVEEEIHIWTVYNLDSYDMLSILEQVPSRDLSILVEVKKTRSCSYNLVSVPTCAVNVSISNFEGKWFFNY